MFTLLFKGWGYYINSFPLIATSTLDRVAIKGVVIGLRNVGQSQACLLVLFINVSRGD